MGVSIEDGRDPSFVKKPIGRSISDWYHAENGPSFENEEQVNSYFGKKIKLTAASAITGLAIMLPGSRFVNSTFDYALSRVQAPENYQAFAEQRQGLSRLEGLQTYFSNIDFSEFSSPVREDLEGLESKTQQIAQASQNQRELVSSLETQEIQDYETSVRSIRDIRPRYALGTALFGFILAAGSVGRIISLLIGKDENMYSVRKNRKGDQQ